MPVPVISSQRERDSFARRPRRRGALESRRPRIGRYLLIAVAAAVVVAFVAVDVEWLTASNPDQLAKHVRRYGRPLGVQPVPSRAIDPTMRKAIVAAEDPRFDDHQGVDPVGIVRAIAYDVSHLSTRADATTIPERVATTLYLGGDSSGPWGEVEEAVMAVKLENSFSRPRILDAYLNTARFGGGAVGIAAAAKRFFGLPPKHLNVAQASLLAGLPQDPQGLDPLRHPRAARERQAEVLRSMVANEETTMQRARRVLTRRLSLVHGRRLAPLRGVDLAAEPSYREPQLALGIALAVVAALGWIVARFRRWPERTRWVAAVICLAGIIVAAGSVNLAA